MNDISSDDIFLLKQRLAEQEALIHALQEKLSNREREIDHLQAQLDKLRRMNFGSRSEKVSRRIAQMEADLNRLQKESDTLTGRVYDPAVQRPLRQTRTRKPFPESLPRDDRDEKRLLPAAPCCPNCGGSLSYLGEDIAEQLELMRSAFRVIRTVREKHACTQCDAIVQAPAPSRPIERGIAGPGLLARVLTSKYAEHTPLYRQSHRAGYRRTGAAGPRADLEVCRAHPAVLPVRNIRPARCGAEPFTAVGLGGCMLPAACCRAGWMHAAGCCLRWKRRFMAMS